MLGADPRGIDGPNSHWLIPSGYVKIAIENGQSIVDLPIEHGDFL